MVPPHLTLGPPNQGRRWSVVAIQKRKASMKALPDAKMELDSMAFHMPNPSRENRGTHIGDGGLKVGEKAAGA